jgi:CRISPR-associated exonuclease Cas4
MLAMAGQKSLPVLSASELDRYAYCPLSWWLERQGQEAEGPELEAGEREHRRAGEILEEARVKEAEAKESDRGVLWFAVAATILSVVGVTLLPVEYNEVFARLLALIALIWLLAASFFLYHSETLRDHKEKMKAEAMMVAFSMVATVLTIGAVTLALISDPVLARFLEVIAVAWLIGASVFFYNSLRKMTLATVAKRIQRIEDDKQVEYVDRLLEQDHGESHLFSSDKYALRGRPDIILYADGKHIPVEMKTGRTPQGPLFSHILQLGAYMLLVEEVYKSPPTHGILRYPERDEKIEWKDDLKKLVLEKMAEMREKLASKDVHRNHNRPGKCRGCSRRKGCPERLE